MQPALKTWFGAGFDVRRRGGWMLVALAVVMVAAFLGWAVYRFHADMALAQQALDRFDFPEAQRRLASCLTWRPRNSEALLLAAQAARRDGQLDAAQEFLTRLDKGGADADLQWTLLAVQRGRVKKNVQSLINELEIRHPASEQILEALLQGCVHVYRLDEASFWTKQLLARYPTNPIGRLVDAQLYETLRRRDKAVDILHGLLADFPTHDKAELYLAELLSKQRDYDAARRHYLHVRARRPGDLAPLLGLARTLIAQEKRDEAAPLIRELEEQHGDKAVALLECGRFELQRERPDEAAAVLERAVHINPFDHEIHFELAVCLERLGRSEESRRHLERFKQIEADMMLLDKAFQATIKTPNDPEPRLDAGRICVRNQQYAEALRWLYGALEVDPRHAATHHTLADLFAAQGDLPSALHHRQLAR